MKKLFCLCLVMVFCVFSSMAFAADDSGYFSIDDVTIDGEAWDCSCPEITMGETYTVDMNVSYAVADSGWFQDIYSDGVYAEIQLPWLVGFGPVVWSASQSSPSSIATSQVWGETQVDSATWALTGDLMVPENPAYLGTRLAGLSVYTDGGDSGSVAFDLRCAENAAPVPEPATILLLGIGLLGIVGVSKRKKKA